MIIEFTIAGYGPGIGEVSAGDRRDLPPEAANEYIRQGAAIEVIE